MENKNSKQPSASILDSTYSILLNEKVAHDTYRMRIDAPILAQTAVPGQFVNVRITRTIVPLLRRPFSIHRVNPDKNWIELLFDIRGEGTEILARFKRGEWIDILGPLGNSFSVSKEIKMAVLIAGGIGIAPLLFLAQALTALKVKTRLYYGVRHSDQFCCLDDFKQLGVKIKLASEDGKTEFAGFVTDLFLEDKNQGKFEKVSPNIFACGPPAMLRKVQRIGRDGSMPTELSLEAIMGCGFGVCMGCAIPANTSTIEKQEYKLVCQHGPIFNSEEVIIPE